MLLTLTLLAQVLSPPQLGHAGIFGDPGDRWDNGQRACRQRSGYGVAHRSLPCGTRLMVCAPRCVVATVVDSGPWGAADGKRYRVVRRLPAGWRWRGELDLLPETARAIGTRGGAILWRVVQHGNE